jgi:hypothetical protein
LLRKWLLLARLGASDFLLQPTPLEESPSTLPFLKPESLNPWACVVVLCRWPPSWNRGCEQPQLPCRNDASIACR